MSGGAGYDTGGGRGIRTVVLGREQAKVKQEETKMHDDEWDAFLKDGKFYLVDTIRPHHTYKDDKGKPIVFDDLDQARAAADARTNAMVLTPGKTAGWGNQPL